MHPASHPNRPMQTGLAVPSLDSNGSDDFRIVDLPPPSDLAESKLARNGVKIFEFHQPSLEYVFL